MNFSPLLVLTGEENARISFEELHRRICDALWGNRAPVMTELFLPDGTHEVIRAQKKPTDTSGDAKTDLGSA